MKNAVVDASFLLTAVFDKKPQVNQKLKELLDLSKRKQLQIYAPSLINYEFTNGLRFSLIEKSDIGEIYLKFTKLPIKIFHLSPRHFEDILKLSLQIQTTIYDTSYHFLGLLLDATFYTCDKEYFQKAKSLGQIELV